MVEEAVTENHIAQVVSRWTGVPVDRMLEGERGKLLKMEAAITRRVVGQREAVRAVATAVRRARAGLQDPQRPIGSFMFLGPTGVGKTELTRALAEFLFDDEHALIRVDMSEYMEKHSVARLIGAPPGYVGYDEGGALTEAVRRRPYQVVLFDEIEKAHPDVFNILLQVLDDGRLTDGQGRTVDFRNTLIVMTSNLGSDYLVSLAEGQDADAVRGEVMGVVRAHFRPEFLNRLDEIILFHRLKREDIAAIVDIQLARLGRLLADRKITIELDRKAIGWLAEKGYDPAYGARPLKRVIQKHLQDPLAEQILSGAIAEGDRVKVTAGKMAWPSTAGMSRPRPRSAVLRMSQRCHILIKDAGTQRRSISRERRYSFWASCVASGASFIIATILFWCCLEGGEDCALELTAAGDANLHRIDRPILDADLVMQMRSGRAPGRSDITDDLALIDLAAVAHALGKTAHVGVEGSVSASCWIFTMMP